MRSIGYCGLLIFQVGSGIETKQLLALAKGDSLDVAMARRGRIQYEALARLAETAFARCF
ncbi:MAG: hypothetical protein M2R45_03729 [Verrucomicrobia subdivision 3 bacterium]|nr:hypothetical protein [Limisphaerales bacterium]MCS1416947.1 hypothetical protein [Limisphaerales bacterium]